MILCLLEIVKIRRKYFISNACIIRSVYASKVQFPQPYASVTSKRLLMLVAVEMLFVTRYVAIPILVLR